MKADAILLEFDGVVVDTMAVRRQTLQHVLEVAGIHLTDDEYWEHCAGAGLAGSIRAVISARRAHLDDTDLDLLVHRAEQRFSAHVGKGVVLVEGARSALERLAASARLAVVSHLRRTDIEAIIAMARLDHLFLFVIGAEDASPGKPHPAPYLAALRRLGRYRGHAEGQVVALEHGRDGIRAARAAQIPCVVMGTLPAHVVLEAQAYREAITDLDASTLASLLESPHTE